MDIKTLKAIQSNFLKELQDANSGKKTSLPFIVHQIPSYSLVKNKEIFEVLVIGGSIWKKAICQKTKDGIEFIKKQTERPVVFNRENDFLSFIDSELSSDVKVLALNFAYPLKPIFENRRLDGILLAVSKESKFTGLVGKKIGAEIEKYILAERKKKIIVSVANDTICLLLSGLTKYSFDELAGGVDGTGLNFAFFIDKEKAVNLESANFDKFPQSQEGKIIDKQSAKPGAALFEKETSGAYLYKHFNLIIKKRGIDYPSISSTEELDLLSRKNLPQVSEIARNLIKRSAQLVACQIAGITEFKRHDPTSTHRLRGSSMIFNMEGSLFWKSNGYKESVEETVKLLVAHHKIKFVEIESSAILGAAKLVS